MRVQTMQWHGDYQDLSAILADWGLRGVHKDNGPVLCLALPDFVAHLVVRGMWRELLVLARWHQPVCGWYRFWQAYPDQQFCARVSGLHAEPESQAVPMTAAHMHRLASDMVDTARTTMNVRGVPPQSRAAMARRIATVRSFGHRDVGLFKQLPRAPPVIHGLGDIYLH